MSADVFERLGSACVALIGCGKMGTAMLSGWLDGGLGTDQIAIVEPEPSAALRALISERSLRHIATVRDLPGDTDIAVLVMAVKPQVMDEVFTSAVERITPKTLVLSIAAGRTIESFARIAPANTAIVRAIPNTPAAIGRGITVCFPNASVRDEQRGLCEALLTAVGEVGWVAQEELIDAATAVSGSGPAYVFLLAECLARAGTDVGLPPELAARLANATVSGGGELIRQSVETPAVLRENVTSPNGTTQAALDVLMADETGLQDLLTRAVRAAAERSRELSN